MNDLKRIFVFLIKISLSKTNIILFSVFFLVLLYLAHCSLISYKVILKDKEIFVEAEKSKSQKYTRYNQYGSNGIRLMLIPAPINILFDDTLPFNEILSKINSADILSIYQRLKGKNFFFEASGLDIFGVLFIFGAFFGMLAGYLPLRKNDYLKILSRASNYKKVFFFILLSKLIILSFSFLLLLGGILLWSSLNSFNIVSLNLLYVVLAFISILAYFLSIGALLGAYRKQSSLIAFGSLFFIMIFFVPLISNKLVYVDASNLKSLFNFELDNLKIIIQIEKRFDKQFGTVVEGKDDPPDEYKKMAKNALNTDFNLLRQRENKLKKKILKKIIRNQALTIFFPITFWKSIKKEMCSKGGRSFIDFYSFTQTRKDEFLNFYVEKRFSKIDKNKPFQIESFIKNEENIYYSKSQLPYNFGLGIVLTLLYTLGLLLLSYRLHLKRLKRESGDYLEVDIDSEGDKNFTFLLCENHQFERGIFNYYQDKEAVCLEKIDPTDFKFNGIQPADLLKHLSRVSGVDESKARENLKIMGVDIDSVKLPYAFQSPKFSKEEKEKVDEIILKIYAAVKLAEDRQIIVIDDFLKKQSRQFERDLIDLFCFVIAKGKRIIYLSTDIFQTDRFEEVIKIREYRPFPIEDSNLRKVSFR